MRSPCSLSLRSASLRSSRLLTVALISVFAVCLSSGVIAQDADESKEAATGDFASLHADWKKLDAELVQLEADFTAEQDEAKKEELKTQYTELVGKAKELAPKLRESAVAAFLADPNDDDSVSRLLIGMIDNDLFFARIDDAMSLADKTISAGMSVSMFEALRDSSRLTGDDLRVVDEIILRAEEAKQDDLPRVSLETSKGTVVIELFEDQAPGTVGNFVSLVEDKFYDGVVFHRVLDDFMAQGGDPKGDGTGDPGYKIKDETTGDDVRGHFRGSLSMANSGRKDTGGSQFFICFNERATRPLNGKHTVFGRVIEGMEVVDKFTRRDPTSPDAEKITPDKIVTATVIRKRDHEYAPDKAGE